LSVTVSCPSATVVPRRPFRIELLALLIVVRDLHVRSSPHLPASDPSSPSINFNSVVLPEPFTPNQADAIAAHDACREVANHRPAVERLREAFSLEHDLSAPVTHLGLEPHRAHLRAASRTLLAHGQQRRTRPSFLVRRALIPCRSHASSSASFLSNFASCAASTESASSFLRRNVA
jgi:hypothetical protein